MLRLYGALIMLLCCSNIFAALPVVDFTAITHLVKEYNQLTKQYDLLQETYHKAEQQLDTAKEIVSTAEGHYKYGDLLNGNKELKNLEWSPDSWNKTLLGLSGGNPKRYRELLRAYQKDNNTLSQKAYRKGASKSKAMVYKQGVATNRAAAVNASYAFNEVKNYLEKIHKLSNQIEKAPNTKAAIDLNNRIQTEGSYIAVQILKQIAILNEQIAREYADKIASESEGAAFNTVT